MSFFDKNPWTILTKIEKGIKDRIEERGIKLKNWEICVNYGIKTGLNKAFIINEELRAKLINEDPKCAEIIRPILRGKDIRKYGYSFSNLYLICTFPSLKIDIEKYPSIEQYLKSFGIKKLEQSGKRYFENGVEIQSRKKTNNKWFETQDSINYWDDFSKPKIIYPDISSDFNFAYDEKGFFLNNTSYFITGDKRTLLYLFGVLNSKVIGWFYKLISVQLGSRAVRMFSQYVLTIPIPKVDQDTENEMVLLSSKLINDSKNNEILGKKINELVFKIFNFSNEEVAFFEKLAS